MKYVFITGGVTSSLGKGIMAASLGRLLKARGYTVGFQKLDLYYNAEPALLSPMEHGEIFVTDDGSAVDLDLGNYERFVDVTLPGTACCTTGKIHKSLLEKEQRGDFCGATIQAIPHITNEIKRAIREAATAFGAEINIVEIGGTVGDMEASVYLEAIRQMRLECSRMNDCCYVHMTLMPYIATSGELKTKPTQNSVKALRSVGIQPDVIVCRTEVPVSGEAKEKIALFCNVKTSNVIQNLDVEMLYDQPMVLEREGLARAVLNELGLPHTQPALEDWLAYVNKAREAVLPVHVALVGKYNEIPDAYLSVLEALRHAGVENGACVQIDRVRAQDITPDGVNDMLSAYDAVVLPGGFGHQGAEGIILAARYAREHNVPCLAIGYGAQLAVVSFARDALGLSNANSAEVEPCCVSAIVKIPEERVCQNDSRASTRMGRSGVKLLPSNVQALYGGVEIIEERHSNRYEIDPAYLPQLSAKGLRLSGTSLDVGYPEAFELDNHPFYTAVVYHPEYISRPGKPHPLFNAFIKAALSSRVRQGFSPKQSAVTES